MSKLELNQLPEDKAVVYNKKYQDYPMFVQSVGRIGRFSLDFTVIKMLPIGLGKGELNFNDDI